MRLNDSEWKVMQALWGRHPATARDVLEQVERETAWAYTTVKTLLARLVEKGADSCVRPVLAHHGQGRECGGRQHHGWEDLV